MALRRVQSVGDAMSALLSLHFSSTLSTTQSEEMAESGQQVL